MTRPFGGDVVAGLRLALTTLTVAPVRAGRVDRRAAAWAMSLAPLVGVALGLALGGVGIGLRALGAAPLIAAVVVVGAGALATRGLHLDGLADTVDGLGSYRDAEGALEIMKKPDVGPFGVAAVTLSLLAQTAALTTLLGREPWPALAAVVTMTATGRLAVSAACRRGVPAARPEGLGALVAGTVPIAAVAAWTVVLGTLGYVVHPVRGPLAVLVGLAATLLLVRHATRRFGGVTGDVLGACVELATCLTALTLAI
jgi:adenosylcobinamide-GDP ribazoletransferase